ncbi:MAG: hypothetical protein ABI843_09030 [Dokdonella sp.]
MSPVSFGDAEYPTRRFLASNNLQASRDNLKNVSAAQAATGIPPVAAVFRVRAQEAARDESVVVIGDLL